MGQLTEEQQQRLRQVRERQPERLTEAKRLGDEWCIGEEVLGEIDFLLSLLDSDSQAANGDDPCDCRSTGKPKDDWIAEVDSARC